MSRRFIWWGEIDPHLGTAPDKDIAERFGVHPTTIRARRSKLGIERFSRNQNLWDEIDPFLGTALDREVAERFGISAGMVCYRRGELGIPPYTPPVPFETAARLRSEEMRWAARRIVDTPLRVVYCPKCRVRVQARGKIERAFCERCSRPFLAPEY